MMGTLYVLFCSKQRKVILEKTLKNTPKLYKAVLNGFYGKFWEVSTFLQEF